MAVKAKEFWKLYLEPSSFAGSYQVYKKAYSFLTPSDKRKSLYVICIYVILGILDIFAVFAFGLVGSLAVNGLSSKAPGDRTTAILELLRIRESSLQVQVSVIGLLAASILVLKSVSTLYLSRKTLYFLSRRCASMSQVLITRFLSQDILKVRVKTTQETIYSITTGVQQVVLGIIGASLLLFADLFLIFAFTVSMFLVDTVVALLSLFLFAGTGFLLYKYMHKRAETLGGESTKAEIYSGQKIFEVISCYREVAVKNRRQYYANEIGSLRSTISEAQAGLSILGQISKYIMEITLVAGCITVGAFQFATQPASRAVAVISVFLIASARIAPAVLRLQSGIVSIRTNIVISKPTLDLMSELNEDLRSKNYKDESKNLEKAQFLHDGFNSSVELEDVQFRYPEKRSNALSHINLKILPGQFVGIAGTSGSGKSTLADLILGMLKPTSGKVKISGIEPAEAIRRWPGAIAYVPQEVNIVSGSIKDNVCLGYNPKDFNDDEIEKLLRMVQLSELLDLPQGIHAATGERGSKLSGGQRQRIGIARALLTNPKLLILDEATSALDATTESNIVNYFSSIKKEITMIVIAHRLSTIRSADKVVYIKSGKLIGAGRFSRLIKDIPELRKQAKLMGVK